MGDTLKPFETERMSTRYWLELPKGAGQLIHFADTTLGLQMSWDMSGSSIPIEDVDWDRRWDGIYYTLSAERCGPKYHDSIVQWFKERLKEWKKERKNYLP